MRFPNGGRPPTARDAADDPRIEQPARTLADKFNASGVLSQDAPTALPRERLRYLAGRLHSLGARPLFEFLREIEAGADLHEHLERYCELAPLTDFIAEWGGDRLPPARLVGGRRP